MLGQYSHCSLNNTERIFRTEIDVIFGGKNSSLLLLKENLRHYPHYIPTPNARAAILSEGRLLLVWVIGALPLMMPGITPKAWGSCWILERFLPSCIHFLSVDDKLLLSWLCLISVWDSIFTLLSKCSLVVVVMFWTTMRSHASRGRERSKFAIPYFVQILTKMWSLKSK